MSEWYQLTLILSLPPPSLLIHPYSSLPPLSPSTFSPLTPLTTRLRSLDLISYSLLSLISPSLTRQLPIWPPPTHSDAKTFRAALGKVIEGLLKTEKLTASGLEDGVSWRRTFVEEAMGEKWERVLGFLCAMALRAVVRGMRGLEDLQSTTSTLEDVRSTTSKATLLYASEAKSIGSLLRSRQARLASLRRRGQQLLETKANLAAESQSIREDAELDLKHLLALRNDKVSRLPRGVWTTLKYGSPGAVDTGSQMQVERTEVVETSEAEEAIQEASRTSKSIIETHQALLHSLSTLSNTPISNHLPSSTPLPSSHDLISQSLTPTLIQSPQSSFPAATSHEFDFTYTSVSLPTSYSSLLLPLPQSSTPDDLRLAILLDSLEPPPLKSSPPLAPKNVQRSKLPSLIVPRSFVPPIPMVEKKVVREREKTEREEKKTPPRKVIPTVEQEVQDLLDLLGTISPPLPLSHNSNPLSPTRR